MEILKLFVIVYRENMKKWFNRDSNDLVLRYLNDILTEREGSDSENSSEKDTNNYIILLKFYWTISTLWDSDTSI